MSKASSILAGITVALAVGLTGCASGKPGAAPPPSSSPAPSVDCETASQADWQKHCAPTDVPSDVGKEEQQTLPFGEPFEYDPLPLQGETESTTWAVTLTKTECGLKAIPKADSNPEWDGGDEHPEYIAAKPEKGNDFCILHWSWTNKGKMHATPDQTGDIMVGEDRLARSSDDQMRSWTIMDTHLGVQYTDEVNPGKSTKSLDIYQVPAGATPTAVWFPMDTILSGSYLLVATA